MDKFKMLYCDSARCRVNTFEAGDGSDYVDGRPGRCPACHSHGLCVSCHNRLTECICGTA